MADQPVSCFDSKIGKLQVGTERDRVAATATTERIRLRPFLPEQTVGTLCDERGSKVNTQATGSFPFPPKHLWFFSRSPQPKNETGLFRSGSAAQ